MENFKLNSNYVLASTIVRLNHGIARRLRYTYIFNNKITLAVLEILYQQGLIRAFLIVENYIKVFFKFSINSSFNVLKHLSLVSTPGKRIF